LNGQDFVTKIQRPFIYLIAATRALNLEIELNLEGGNEDSKKNLDLEEEI